MDGNEPETSGSTWYAATAVAVPERPHLTIDQDVDVCVIGGGLAGLTVAREVAKRGWSVVVLEGRRVAWNASGRNCGFVLPGFAERLDALVERVGLDTAKAMWKLSEAGVSYVRDTIRDTGMAGVEPAAGWLDVSKTDDGDALLAHIRLLNEFGANIEGWPIEQVRASLKTSRYFHAVHYPTAFHIHPLNYALSLAAAAEAAGVKIFENSPALSIDPAGVRKRVITPSGRVRAAQVVLAGNVHLGGLMPRLSATLVPVTTYVGVTAKLGAKLSDAVAYAGAVSDSEYADNHYRVVDGDRLMWAGRMTTWEREPRRYAKTLAADIRRLYPQLGKIEMEHVWNGTLGRTVHRMPQIGELQPGLYVASGFGGHGINTSAMAGELIARAIVENDPTWRLFSGYELIWAGGPAGRFVAQTSYWARRIGERFGADRAHRREVALQADEVADTAEAPDEAPIAPEPPVEAARTVAEQTPEPKKATENRGPKSRRREKDATTANTSASSDRTTAAPDEQMI
jgi:gamma-glutamylputrescine oxidase